MAPAASGGALTMRLIDADALKTKAIRCETFKLYDAPIFLKAVGTKEIDKAPTVDAVPVVRCKYCAVPHNKYTGYPKLNGLVTPPDFYCPFGERKDDAE